MRFAVQEPHPPPAMDFVHGLVVVRPRGNRDLVDVGRVGHRHQPGLQSYRHLRNGTRLQEFDLFKINRVSPKGFQDQLDVAGRRHDAGAPGPVVEQPRIVGDGESGCKKMCVPVHPVPHQRSLGQLGPFQKQFIVIEWIMHCAQIHGMARQKVDDRTRTRVLGPEIQRVSSLKQRTQGPVEVEARIRVAHQGRHPNRCRRARRHALGDCGLQRAMGRQFQNGPGPEVAQNPFHRRAEPDRLPDVVPPIGAVQSLHAASRDRGHHRHLGGKPALVKERQRGQNILVDGLHGTGVERDVARNQLVLPPGPIQLRHDRLQGRGRPAHHGTRRRVLAGNLDTGVARLRTGQHRLEQGLHPGTVQPDDQHATGAGRPLLKHRPMVDQPRRIRQRQGAAGVGCRHFPRTVAHDTVRVHPPGLEQLHQRALEHERHGLGQFTFVQFRLRSLEAGLAQGPVRMRTPVLLHGIHHPSEHRVRIVQFTSAAGPLSPLPGKHHRQPQFFLVHRGARCRIRIPDKLRQCLHELIPAANRKGGPNRKMGAPTRQVAGQRVEVQRMGPQRAQQIPGRLDQHVGRARRQRHHGAGVGRQGHRPDPRLRRPVLAHHAVSVGAPEPKGVDPHHHGTLRKRFAGRQHPHVAPFKVDLEIGHGEIPGNGRERSLLHHQNRLEQGAVEGGRLHVPQIALDAGDPQGELPVASAERVRNGIAFNPVAHRGAGGMRLDIVEIPGRPPGLGMGRAHQRRLRMLCRRRNEAPVGQTPGAVGDSGRVQDRGLHHRMHAVPVPLRGRQGFDGKEEHTFGAHVAIGIRAERIGPALRTDDSKLVESDAHPGRREGIARAHEGLLAVAGFEGVQGCVQGTQTGGTGRGHGERWSHQVQVIGNPIGQHGNAPAKHAEQVRAVQLAVIGVPKRLRTHEHAGRAVAQRVEAPAGVLHSFPGTVQQHPRHGSGVQHLMMGKTEKTGVNGPSHIIVDQAFVGTARPAVAVGRVNGLNTPAVSLLHARTHHLSRLEKLPEIGVGAQGTGQTMAVPHNGHRIFGIGHFHSIHL